MLLIPPTPALGQGGGCESIDAQLPDLALLDLVLVFVVDHIDRPLGFLELDLRVGNDRAEGHVG